MGPITIRRHVLVLCARAVLVLQFGNRKASERLESRLRTGATVGRSRGRGYVLIPSAEARRLRVPIEPGGRRPMWSVDR